VFLDRVGKGEDDWPLVVPRHSLDHFLREQFADGADTDEDRRLEILDGRDNLWLLQQVFMNLMLNAIEADLVFGTGDLTKSSGRPKP
jgi:hypothetical protein